MHGKFYKHENLTAATFENFSMQHSKFECSKHISIFTKFSMQNVENFRTHFQKLRVIKFSYCDNLFISRISYCDLSDFLIR